MKIINTFIFLLFSLILEAQHQQIHTSIQNNDELISLKSFSIAKKMEYKFLKGEAIDIAKRKGIPIRKESKNGEVMELQRFENGIPIYYITHNLNSAKTISANKLWYTGGEGYNLTGDSICVGVWENGKARASHQELIGKIHQVDTFLSVSEHATHVCGTIAGEGILFEARGIAPNAKIKGYDWNAVTSKLAYAADEGLLVSNHSYGQCFGWIPNFFGDGLWAWIGDPTIDEKESYNFGYYDSESREIDYVIYNCPYHVMVRSAGNERNDIGPEPGTPHWVSINYEFIQSNAIREKDGGVDGYDCITDKAVAKNIITVGAIGDIENGIQTADEAIMTSFSSWGPTDDGRIKPDIVANGENLLSASSIADTMYRYSSGTSMAAPSVSGSIALLMEHINNIHKKPFLASTIKGLIIHTADEAGPEPGPDYIFGWGVMNAFKSAQLISENAVNGSNYFLQENQLENNNEYKIKLQADGSMPLKVTLCWTDPPGVPAARSLNPRDKMLVNDLDLRLIKGDSIYYPWKLDVNNPDFAATSGDNNTDNVEKIEIINPVEEEYLLSVSHKKFLENEYQKFSLIISGGQLKIPETPMLSSPSNNISGAELSPILSWKKAIGAFEYQLQLSLDSTFKNVLIDETITSSEYELDQQNNNTTYYWRVKSINSSGKSEWSSTFKYTTMAHLEIKQELQVGWNMISFYVNPLNADIENIFSDIVSNVKLIKDDSGGVYWPEFNFNSLETWDYQKGYQIYLKNPCNLILSGWPLDVTNEYILLSQGWNLVAYLKNSSLDIEIALSSIKDELVIVKNNSGEVFWPEYMFNNINKMQPGEGYLIYLNEDAILTYPMNLNDYGTKSVEKADSQNDNNTGSNSTLLMILDDIPNREEIFVHTYDSILVGKGKVLKNKALLTLKGDDPYTDNVKEGAKENEPLIISFNDSVAQMKWHVNNVLTNEVKEKHLTFESNSVKVLSSFFAKRKDIKNFDLGFVFHQNYPNPFTTATKIDYQIPYDSYVRLWIKDIAGRTIEELINAKKAMGNYSITWNAEKYSTGVYFYTIEVIPIQKGGYYVETKKMILRK